MRSRYSADYSSVQTLARVKNEMHEQILYEKSMVSSIGVIWLTTCTSAFGKPFEELYNINKNSGFEVNSCPA